MKKILISLSIVIISLFTGCGGGGDSSDGGGGTLPTTTMIINTTYTMSSGGVITKVADANVSVETNTTSNTTTATLLSGQATCTGCTAQ